MPRARRREVGGLDDLLLGVMMQEGTVTIHHLHSRMGLSPGSTSRSLERLELHELAKKEAGEDARKTAFEITGRGRPYLRGVWRDTVALSLQSSDPKELFRAVTLALLMGSEVPVKNSIPKFKDLAANRRVRAREVIADAEAKMGPTSSYHGLFHAMYEAGRMRGESEALDAISNEIERIPPDSYRVEQADELE